MAQIWPANSGGMTINSKFIFRRSAVICGHWESNNFRWREDGCVSVFVQTQSSLTRQSVANEANYRTSVLSQTTISVAMAAPADILLPIKSE